MIYKKSDSRPKTHYNYRVSQKFTYLLLIITLLSGSLFTPVRAARTIERQMQEVGAYELIIAMNTLRVSYGLPALVEDPIIDAVAQATAELMAANQMSWHIGNVSGRLQSSGYGGGARVWATENFAVGNMGIDEIMLVWADADHMIPAVNPAYCHVGAGVAKSSNGMTYYVLQAAYTSAGACGTYGSVDGSTPSPGKTAVSGAGGVSQIIVPVSIATPDAEGKIYHVVKPGQSFWSIAIAYKITIKDIEIWNNLKKDTGLQIGQKLFIPGSNTKGYATPTPVGMVIPATPDADGKIVHIVQSYNTLSTIAQAYKVDVNTLLALNGLQEDWPLQIGQQLVIQSSRITPSPTPRPLTPLEKLTPEADGKYYHAVQSGETLSWIADLYEVNVYDLMAWNGLSETTILQPAQKLLLKVAPPATATPTPAPPTLTPSSAPTSTSAPTQPPPASPTAAPGSITPAVEPQPAAPSQTVWIVILATGLAGLLIVVIFGKRK